MAIGNPISSQNNFRTIDVTATAGQTLFTIPDGYEIYKIAVFKNGTRLTNGTDYTAADASTVTLNVGCLSGDKVSFVLNDVFAVPDAIVSAASSQTINGDLIVNGTLHARGTTAVVVSDDFRLSGKDIVLGFTTDSIGNDVSDDTTINGGGIAIASTEGNPLVSLQCAGINTFPATYKQLIWFESGSFAGLNTDAWLSNYAIGIGSTQVPSGVRLASNKVQITDDDIIQVRNINSSGIITATDFNSTSDQTLKTNIQTVDNALDIVSDLRGVSFDWKETGKPSYGVIAQELEQVLPELVGNSDIKTVNYNGIIGVLIEAIKEMKEEIRQLKNS